MIGHRAKRMARKNTKAEAPAAEAGWRHHLRRTSAIIAAVAGLGAILGGLVGYWDTYKTIMKDYFHREVVLSRKVLSSNFSLAVLPFESVGGKAQEYLGAAIADHLTTDLSVHVPGLVVVGEDSSFTYAGKAIDPKKVGEELNATYLLTGNVQRDEARVRVSARLIEAATGKQIWAERLEEDSKDVFQLLDRISGRIANSFGTALLSDNAANAERRSADSKATDLVFRAQAIFLLGIRSLKALDEAEPLYRQALAVDPKNSDAMIGLGYLIAVRLIVYRDALHLTDQQVTAMIAEARDLLDKGAARQPNSALIHNARGRLFSVEHRPHESLQEHEIARSLDPNFAVNYHNLASVLLSLGQPQKAIEYLNEAIRRSPRDPFMGLLFMHLARADVLLGNWDKAIDDGLKARVLRTDRFALNSNLAAAYAQKNDLELAKNAWNEALKARPGATLATLKGDPELNEPEYTALAEPTLFAGLHKLGL
jgi:TolB-like protein/Flp pilus assembly protein TadD